MVSEYYSHTTFVYKMSSIFNNTKTLMNLNLISYFEAFDIYTMATEAGKKGRYHGAVEFHELLVKHFDKNMKMREIRFNYFEDYTITYDRAKYLLKEAIITKRISYILCLIEKVNPIITKRILNILM